MVAIYQHFARTTSHNPPEPKSFEKIRPTSPSIERVDERACLPFKTQVRVCNPRRLARFIAILSRVPSLRVFELFTFEPRRHGAPLPTTRALHRVAAESMASTCIAAGGVFAVARPNQGKAAKAPKRAGSKLWMPKSAAVDSPRIIVEGDKESKMAGLTQLRKEVIMDMEDFAENEVSAADTPPDSPLPLP